MNQHLDLDNIDTEIFIEFVFAVKDKRTLISPEIREEVQKNIADILRSKGHKLLAIACMPDHTHLLIDLNIDISISEIVDEVQANSAAFINHKNWFSSEFSWQDDYATLSYSPWNVHTLVDNILNQEAYHKDKTFKQEYIELLEWHGVDYDEDDLFEWIL